MVWAKTKLMIHDDLLKPLEMMTIHYKGSNPDKFYKEIPLLLQHVFRVHKHNIQEKKIKWEKGDPENIKVEWEVEKDLDNFSYYYMEIILTIKKSKGEGTAVIEFGPVLRTEYPQDSMWQRSLFYEMMRVFWHKTSYNAKRDKYMKEGRRLSTLFIQKLKELTVE